jgi:hypothetical protein
MMVFLKLRGQCELKFGLFLDICSYQFFAGTIGFEIIKLFPNNLESTTIKRFNFPDKL